nr:glycosyltransferase family 9 protein [Allomuricauda sp.]
MDKKGKPTHLLVIRLSAMGDVAMTVPVLQAVLQKYPGVKLTVLTRKQFFPIFSQLEGVSVIGADVKKKHKGLIGLWRLYKELKTYAFDAVVDLHNVLRSNVLKKYFALDRVPFEQINKGRDGKKALTRAKNKDFGPLKSTHQRYADIFAKVGFPVDLQLAGLLSRHRLSDQVLGIVGTDAKKWVGVAPFAAHEGKMYPLTLMEQIITNLNNTDKYKILLFGGGAKESALLDSLALGHENTLNMAGKLSFDEELQLISNLDVMLSMDSGNAHLAANYGIPVVTLWGVTHPYAGFAPFRQPESNALLSDREKYPLIPTSVYGNKLPQGYENVMKTIPVNRVLDKLSEILDQ